MLYHTGETIIVGDKVRLWEGCYGVVVCSLDTGIFSSEYAAEEWEYLKSGILVASDKGGLIHYLKADEDLELIERGSTGTRSEN
jgi:hypothetical protein